MSMLYKTKISLILSIGLLAGCETERLQFVDKKAPLISGVDFDTAKVIAVDAATNQEMPPCTPFAKPERSSTSESPGKSVQPTCHAELVVGDNQELKTALELSKKPLKGQIKTADGKEKPARVVVTVTTLYQGSYCNIIYSGGVQYEICFPAK